MRFKFDFVRAMLLATAGLMALGLTAGQASASVMTGKMTLSSDKAAVVKGETFTVTIREDSGTEPVNAVQTNLAFPATMVSVAKIDSSASAFDIKAEERSDNSKVYIGRGKSGAVLTGSQLVATVTFTAIANGNAEVKFTSGTALVRSTDSQDIFCGTSSAVVKITLPPAPTPTPKPTATPKPSASPTPSPSPTATPKPTPTPIPGSGGATGTPVTLPDTGATAFGGVIGLGALGYTTRMWLQSRRGVKQALRKKR